MRVVIAPDSFKGTASALEVAVAIADGWLSVRPDDDVRLLPMADGGEGTLEAFEMAVPGSIRMPVTVRGPDDRAVYAYWLLLPDAPDAPEPPDASAPLAVPLTAPLAVPGGTAVVELANTSGIALLNPLRPLDAHTFGFGQAIAAALDHGVGRLLLAIGGSSSTDGGAGALRALGARFVDRAGDSIALGNRGLENLAAIDVTGLRSIPAGGALVLSDVTNPLLGRFGAASVFGPQKGANTAQVNEMESGLRNLTRLLPADAECPGAGAAGGTGFGLLHWGAEIAPGSAAIGAALGVPDAVATASVVITGEGRFDSQSAAGKVPAYITGLANDSGAKALLVAGSIGVQSFGFAEAVSLTDLAGSPADAMADPRRWLRDAGVVLALRVADDAL
ncbi:glycerate kinase [Leifsonia sp. A12D58]|uniref:glycerate kinase n=1 Tax=Leifsonia sp. A12D58 TaxID=3397674 RepID=UPI0039DFB48F